MVFGQMQRCVSSLSRHTRKIYSLQNSQVIRTLTTKKVFPYISKYISRKDINVLGCSYTKARSLFTGLVNSKDSVTITFIDREGAERVVQANIDDTLMDVAKDNDIDGIEGACDGTLACSTCHCIFKQEDFDRLGLDFITEDELDMLDLAVGICPTSRLGCAIDVTEDMDGLVITVPRTTLDLRG